MHPATQGAAVVWNKFARIFDTHSQKDEKDALYYINLKLDKLKENSKKQMEAK